MTGASSGIGKATCKILTKYGAQVVGIGRNEKSLSSLKDEGNVFNYVVADITKDGECQRIVETTVKLFNGELTTVVNGAGGLQGGSMGDINIENYHYNMKLNTQAPFEIMTHAIPYLKQQHEKDKNMCPSIINVSSVNGKQVCLLFWSFWIDYIKLCIISFLTLDFLII